MSDQPEMYTKEYVDQLKLQLHEAQKDADWFKSRCCHWWNIFKTDEPVPMLNWIINKTPVIIRGSLTEVLYDDKKQFELIGEKHRLANELLTTDLILRKSDGSTFFSESICTKAYDPYGKVVGLVGIHKDVTEEYRTAELHKRYERTLQIMIDNAPVRALMLDSGFNIIFANQRFADHLNIQMSKLIGAHAPEVVKDCSLREHRLANVQLVLDTGIPLTFIDQENGRWLEHYLAPLEYTNTNDKRVAVFMHDITDRIQQEELERKKIAAELHEVVSEMLESHENNRAGFQDKLKEKSLTPREMEVLREVASGLSTKQISIKHKVSTKTVESQRLSIMRKLSLFNVADLTRYAIKEEIVSLNE